MSTFATKGGYAWLHRSCLALLPLGGACAGTATSTVSIGADLRDTARPVVVIAEKAIEVGASPERPMELRPSCRHR